MKINLYDFDKTIYAGDSSVDFFVYCLSLYPSIYLELPGMLFAAILKLLHLKTKTQMKERIFRYVRRVPNIDKVVESFWKSHDCYIKNFYMKKKHDKDVIISASPEFLLTPICKQLGVKLLLASKIDKKTGKYTGVNCHGEEKVNRLNKAIKDYEVMESYSDSKVDIPILKLAKKAYYVKGEKLIPTKF